MPKKHHIIHDPCRPVGREWYAFHFGTRFIRSQGFRPDQLYDRQGKRCYVLIADLCSFTAFFRATDDVALVRAFDEDINAQPGDISGPPLVGDGSSVGVLVSILLAGGDCLRMAFKRGACAGCRASSAATVYAHRFVCFIAIPTETPVRCFRKAQQAIRDNGLPARDQCIGAMYHVVKDRNKCSGLFVNADLTWILQRINIKPL
ncbi:MAG: hypothetical protein MUF78_00610 [Candidatus Edwardsbacteria bacterium]|jgi:hypothetical protein|nr:hypothetical protein [Candidatus Edwardsbacteria bacterium]